MGFDTREFEYADIRVNVFGAEVDEFRGVTTKESQEKELVYGAGNRPRSIQRGNIKYEGSLMLLQSGTDKLDVAARAAGYPSIIHVPGKYINIVIVYEKSGDPLIKTKALKNVEFTELEDGMKQGDKFRENTLPFIYLTEVNS